MKLAILSLLVTAGAMAQTNSGDWTAYGKNSFGWRYSELGQINTANVSRLAAQFRLSARLRSHSGR